jgi:hypothetical protein
VHAPTEEKEEIEKEAFYQKVEEVYDSCPSDIKILLGDLYAEVGREEIYQELEDIVRIRTQILMGRGL